MAQFNLGDHLLFEQSLKVGDEAVARWTNSGNYYARKARVVRINRASFRVAVLEGDASYPEGHEIVVPRFDAMGRWSPNNCVTPVAADGG